MISLNENSASVYVIILNWNHKDDLIETIESFKKQDYPNLKLVISDNGSTDDSIPTVKKNYNDIVVIENEDNLGWAAGNNVGIQYALDNNPIPSRPTGLPRMRQRRQDRLARRRGHRLHFRRDPGHLRRTGAGLRAALPTPQDPDPGDADPRHRCLAVSAEALLITLSI